MSKYMTKSKATQMSEMQQAHKAQHPGPDVAVMPAHKDIARRAYEIYLKNGRRQGQSEKNWYQAEQELKNQDEWLQADVEMKTW